MVQNSIEDLPIITKSLHSHVKWESQSPNKTPNPPFFDGLNKYSMPRKLIKLSLIDHKSCETLLKPQELIS